MPLSPRLLKRTYCTYTVSTVPERKSSCRFNCPPAETGNKIPPTLRLGFPPYGRILLLARYKGRVLVLPSVLSRVSL